MISMVCLVYKRIGSISICMKEETRLLNQPPHDNVQLWAQIADLKEQQYQLYLLLSTLLDLCIQHQFITEEEWKKQLITNLKTDDEAAQLTVQGFVKG